MCGDKSPEEKKVQKKALSQAKECVENAEDRQVSTRPILEAAVHPNFYHNVNSQEA